MAFWVLFVLILASSLVPLAFLLFRIREARVVAAKFFMLAATCLIWYRFSRQEIASLDYFSTEKSLWLRAVVEFLLFILAVALSGLFDAYFIRNDVDNVGRDLIGVSFATLLFLVLFHLRVNFLTLAASVDGEPLNCAVAFVVGGLLYAAVALVKAYRDDKILKEKIEAASRARRLSISAADDHPDFDDHATNDKRPKESVPRRGGL